MSQLKRILLIAETFFPDRSVSAIRVTEWCRHLPEFGWKPIVLCRYFGASASQEELAAAVHSEVEVYYLDRPNAASPDGNAGLRQSTIRRWSPVWIGKMLSKELSAPDPQIGFWRCAAHAQALEMVDRLRPKVVLTTSPPHSIHDVGIWLSSQRPQLPWVADFRDPYLIDRRFGLRRLRRLRAGRHRRFEADVYAHAALITHAIDFQARWARRRYPHARGRIRTLPNGVPLSLAEQRIAPVPSPAGRRSIRVMGASDHDQRMQLARSVLRLSQSNHDLELRFIGPRCGGEQQLADLLGSQLVLTGNLPHEEALGQLLGGDVLVCVLNERHSQCMGLSSKLFEYLACGKPILVINPTRPDRLMFKRLGGVRLLTRPTDEQVRDALQWALSPEAIPLGEQTEMIREKYSRRSQTHLLAQWLDEITSGNAVSSPSY